MIPCKINRCHDLKAFGTLTNLTYSSYSYLDKSVAKTFGKLTKIELRDSLFINDILILGHYSKIVIDN